jgi:hypothetical protein
MVWLALRHFTNDREKPAISRRFMGFRAASLGVIMMIATTLGLYFIFGDPINLESSISSSAISLVIVPALLIHLWLLFKDRPQTLTPRPEPPAAA